MLKSHWNLNFTYISSERKFSLEKLNESEIYNMCHPVGGGNYTELPLYLYESVIDMVEGQVGIDILVFWFCSCFYNSIRKFIRFLCEALFLNMR